MGVVYLVLLGLLGHYVLPWYRLWRADMSDQWSSRLTHLQSSLAYINPFKLLASIGQGHGGFGMRLLAVLALLTSVVFPSIVIVAPLPLAIVIPMSVTEIIAPVAVRNWIPPVGPGRSLI